MLGGRELVLETGKYAKLVSASVIARYGDTVLLVTAQMSEEAAPGDFLPLAVEYEERHYAIGKIPGSYQRREGRPGLQATLNARIVDRQIRPLFPKNLRNEIQIIITVLSADQVTDPAPIAAIATSAALSISNIPWDGPTACVNVGFAEDKYLINPSYEMLKSSSLELTIAGSEDAILMVEAGANELSEAQMIGAIEIAHREIASITQLIKRMQIEIGQEKTSFEPAVELKSEDIEAVYQQALTAGLYQSLLTQGKKDRAKALDDLGESIVGHFVPDAEAEGATERTAEIKEAFDKAMQRELRRMVLAEDLRSDKRKPHEIRPIWIEAGVLPKVHGSAVFTRGETQVLSVSTLGTGRDNRLVDDLGLDETEEFMLHYNFGPFSTGEVKRLRGVSRRELGHGNLARRALERMIPSQENFPYVIRVVAETLESNGSSSMATVCSSSLSLMDAGVPLKKPVAGIAMGLIKEGDTYKILSDILGSEDALGDMDFKVTGTTEGITALQMDIKIKGITPEIMRHALAQAKEGRMHILGLMNQVLAKPRPEISPHAPRILQLKIPVDKIGAVIGPGGKNIRELEAFGASIEIAEDGMVRIYSESSVAAAEVKHRIETMTASIEVGRIYDGVVTKIIEFGAFITLIPGTDGFLHISQIAPERVHKVEDYLQVGDKLRVKVYSIDDRSGKPDLVRPELEGLVSPRSARSGGGGGGSGSGSGGGSRNSGGRNDSRNDRRNDGRNDRGSDRSRNSRDRR
ncbi:MAG: polyribonucleotide nucleotidyltransferase [Deinococcales bacterium]